MKKKSFILGVMIVCLLILTGCGKKEAEKTMTCTRTMDQNGMKINLTYNVEYNGKYVSRVKSEEIVETDSEGVLDSYKEQIESIYSPYKDIEYYDYDVKIEGNKLTSTVNINYAKIDTDKLIKIDSSNGSLIKDGKINIDDMKSVYEQIGASCDKK